MFRIIGSFMAISSLALAASPAAEAHGNHYRAHTSPGYHYGVVYRKRHMPAWLWNKRGFRQWYFRTPLRFDRRLAWRELHDAYRWERRYGHRGHYRAHLGARKYRLDHDRRYWRDDDRWEHQGKKRRRHRDD